MLSCRSLYAIGAFLASLSGSLGFLAILPQNVAVAFVAFTAAYIASVAIYCHSTDRGGSDRRSQSPSQP